MNLKVNSNPQKKINYFWRSAQQTNNVPNL